MLATWVVGKHCQLPELARRLTECPFDVVCVTITKEVSSKTSTSSGADACKYASATASGAGRIKSIRIDPVAVDKRDIEMLEDLVTAACNDALRKAQELVEGEMGGLTGGLDLGQLGSLFSKGS